MKSLCKPVIHKLMFPFVLMGVLIGLSPAMAGEIYKWVDQDNHTQYTQTPPPAGTVSERIETRAPQAGSGKTAANGLKERLKASDERNKEADEAAAREDKKAEIARIKKQNCEAARNNLELLNRNGRIRYRDSNGQVVHLSDEERASRIEESRQQIKQYCEG